MERLILSLCYEKSNIRIEAGGGHAPLVPTAFGVFHYPPSGATAPQRPAGIGKSDATNVMLRLDRSIHYANRLGHATRVGPPIKSEGDDSAPASCSDLIGASIRKPAWTRNTGRPSDQVGWRRFGPNVMLRLDWSIHYRLGHATQGRPPPNKSEGDDSASTSCSDLIGASTTQTGLDTQQGLALRSSRRATIRPQRHAPT